MIENIKKLLRETRGLVAEAEVTVVKIAIFLSVVLFVIHHLLGEFHQH